jgi:hypothetical protein
MAIRIAPTPVLEGQEAADFLKRVAKEQKEKKSLTPTPKLQGARSKLMADVRSRKK